MMATMSMATNAPTIAQPIALDNADAGVGGSVRRNVAARAQAANAPWYENVQVGSPTPTICDWRVEPWE
jgi:hypothetical protein